MERRRDPPIDSCCAFSLNNRRAESELNYVAIKRCYDARLGYLLVFINEVELERARSAMAAIEAGALKEEPTLQTGPLVGGSKQASAPILQARARGCEEARRALP